MKGVKGFIPWKEGELGIVALMAVNVFILLSTYYLLKVVREPLILVGGGAEVKSYASAGQAVLLLAVVPGFGLLASKVNRIRLLVSMQTLFAGCLIAFYFLAKADVPIGVAFYLWLGIFSVLVVSNFWSFATDLFTQEQGKRLFGLIGIGASVGAVAGAVLPELIHSYVGTYELMLIAAGGLALSALLYVTTDRLDIRHHPEHEHKRRPTHADEAIGKEGGFQLVLTDRYLRYVAAMIVIGTVVNSNGEYIIGKLVSAAGDHAPNKGDYIEQFYSQYYTIVNFAGLAIQGLVVTKVMGVVGVRRALFIMPLIVLGSWTTFLAAAMLQVLRVTKTAENSIDYSLNNTLKQALFLPTTREVKYKAKAAIDTFFVRSADVVSAGFVFVFVQTLGGGLHVMAAINIGLTIGWLVLARNTGKQFDELTAKPA
ncbi:MAG: Npt1/Npt2 family nucleotide transporter [Kofleriaceae bacterium]